MPGPWDGPVRVVEHARPRSFRLVTLGGPPRGGPDRVPRLERRAARVRDRVLGAQRRPALGAAVRPPAHLEGGPVPHVDVVPGAGGRALRRAARRRPPDPHTPRQRREDVPAGADAATRARALDELHDRPLNFDPADATTWTEEEGWRIDDYCQPLPAGAARASASRTAAGRARSELHARLRVRRPGDRARGLRPRPPARGPQHAARGALLGAALPLRACGWAA